MHSELEKAIERRDGPTTNNKSSAVRASSTALKIAEACGYQGEITVENSLYGSGYTEYLNAVKKRMIGMI